MQKEISLKRLYLQLAIAVTIIAFSAILIKLSSAPPLIIAFYRMFYAVVILSPVFAWRYRRRAGYFLDYRLAVVGFFLALHFFLWITSFEYTDVANSVIFVALQPLFTLILEAVFAREDLRKGVISGVIIALLGSIIISIVDVQLLFSRIWGDLLALSAALFAALYLFIGRSLRKELDYFPYIYIIYTYAALFLGIFVLVSRQPLGGYERINHLYFLAMALGPTIIGHSTLNYSVRFLPTTVVSLAVLGEPILTTFYAWLLLGSQIRPVVAMGGALIIIGIYRAMVSKSAKKRRPELKEADS